MDSGIYLITNKETNQKYVGGSINIKKRLNEHKRSAHINSQYIDRAIKKHGFKNFDYQIITLLPSDWDIISKHEKYWIKYYNTFENPKHYNLTKGGEGTVGYIPHNSTRQKMSDAKKGSNHPFWKDSPRIVKSGIKNGKQNYAIKYEGKILKQSVHYEFLEYLLDKFINNELTENQIKNYDIHSYGIIEYKHSDETRKKISKNNARYWKGKHLSAETKKKMSEARSGNKSSSWKDYARITNAGFKHGKPNYVIRMEGKIIKQSNYIHNLINWFFENYPKEPLHMGVHNVAK